SQLAVHPEAAAGVPQQLEHLVDVAPLGSAQGQVMHDIDLGRGTLSMLETGDLAGGPLQLPCQLMTEQSGRHAPALQFLAKFPTARGGLEESHGTKPMSAPGYGKPRRESAHQETKQGPRCHPWQVPAGGDGRQEARPSPPVNAQPLAAASLASAGINTSAFG